MEREGAKGRKRDYKNPWNMSSQVHTQFVVPSFDADVREEKYKRKKSVVRGHMPRDAIGKTTTSKQGAYPIRKRVQQQKRGTTVVIITKRSRRGYLLASTAPQSTDAPDPPNYQSCRDHTRRGRPPSRRQVIPQTAPHPRPGPPAVRG